MEKKFNIVVGEDGTVKLPDEVLEKLEVKPGEEVRFEVDDNFYAVRLLSRICLLYTSIEETEKDTLRQLCEQVEHKIRTGEDHGPADKEFHAYVARCTHNLSLIHIFRRICQHLQRSFLVGNWAFRQPERWRGGSGMLSTSCLLYTSRCV